MVTTLDMAGKSWRERTAQVFRLPAVVWQSFWQRIFVFENKFIKHSHTINRPHLFLEYSRTLKANSNHIETRKGSKIQRAEQEAWPVQYQDARQNNSKSTSICTDIQQKVWHRA